MRALFWLPAGHFVVDLILLFGCIYQGLLRFDEIEERARVQPILLLQEETPGFDLDFDYPIPVQWRLIVIGTAPAGVISTMLRPDSPRQGHKGLWDPTWFAIHEGFAITLWFLFARRLPSPLMRGYLAVRAALAFVAIFSRTEWLVWFPALFWLGLLAYGISQLKRVPFLWRVRSRATRR